MNKKYDEIMQHVEVTPQMRQRILSNIENTDFTAKPASKTGWRPYVKQFAALAACLVLVLLCTTAAPGLFKGQSGPESSGPLSPANGIVQVESIEELSEMVDFQVYELKNLPFQAEEVAYASYWNEMADITYKGEGQTATWRMSTGSDDISGDFNTYDKVTSISVNGADVSLKGSTDSYVLATWTDGNYSYSLSLSEGLTETTWQIMLNAGYSIP